MRALILLLFIIPAFAADPLGTLTTPSGKLVLHNEPGHCIRGARLVVWTDAAGDVPGCWAPMHHEGQSLISVALSDGDTYRLPVQVFLPATSRPQRAPGTTL